MEPMKFEGTHQATVYFVKYNQGKDDEGVEVFLSRELADESYQFHYSDSLGVGVEMTSAIKTIIEFCSAKQGTVYFVLGEKICRQSREEKLDEVLNKLTDSDRELLRAMKDKI